MLSLRRLFLSREVKSRLILFTVSAFSTLLFVVMSSAPAYAAGAVGSGGVGTNTGGGAWSYNGWGWYNYPTDGTIVPYSINNGGIWSSVMSTCAEAGADRIIAFIALRVEGTDAKTGVVFDYKTSWDGFKHYNGRSGGGWMPTNTARGFYDSATMNKSGYTFGDNVGWFCYNSNPPVAQTWSIDANISIDSGVAVPGSRVTWTHNATVSNASTGRTTEDVKFGPASPPDYDRFSGTTGLLSAGAAKNNSGTAVTSYVDVPVDASAGTEYCRKTKVYPKSSAALNSSKNSGELCARVDSTPITPVPDDVWILSPATDVRTKSPGGSWTGWKRLKHRLSPVTINIGDHYQWRHRVSNLMFDRTDHSIDYYYNDGSTDHYIGNIPADNGITLFSPKTVHSQEFIADDVLGMRCRNTWTSGRSISFPNTPAYSVWSCVDVVNPIEWDALAEVSIDKTRAKPLDTVTWTHKVKNGGPDKNDKIIDYGYNTTATTPGGLVTTGDIGKGSIPINTDVSSSIRTFTTTIQIPYGAGDSQKICRSTYASPKSHLSDDRITTAEKCVTVDNRPWSLEVASVAEVKQHDDPAWHKYTDSAYRAVEPMDTIRWKHTVTNSALSEVSTNQEIEYWYKNHDLNFDRLFGGVSLKGLEGGRRKQSSPVGIGVSFPPDSSPFYSKLSGTEKFIISQDDVGKKFCRSTIAEPRSHIVKDKIESVDACVEVKYNYNLTPSINADILEIGTATGNKHEIKTNVKNDGPTKSRPDVSWQLTKFVKNVNTENFFQTSSYAMVESTNNPCGQYASEAANRCEAVEGGTREFPKDNTSKTFTDDELYSIGSRICYVMSIKPYKEGLPGIWRHSSPVCISIGKTPKVQVWGGDVWSRKEIKMKTTAFMNNTYGSWAEYALFSNDKISSMASKSMLGETTGTVEPEEYSQLSFTNWDAPSNIGNYKITRALPNISANYPIGSAEKLLDGTAYGLSDTTSFPPSKRIYTVDSGNTILLSGDVPSGRTIIINAPKATVKIVGDINYPSEDITSIDEIPQLLIIAKDIKVSGLVENIDAWLVAVEDVTSPDTGTIDTCFEEDIAAIRINSECKKQLRINGPVIANKLFLKRTYGSDETPGYGTPAEIINFRADAYLWSVAQSAKNNTIRTVYSVEQPPRF